MISTAACSVLEMLEDDLVSCGWLLQLINESGVQGSASIEQVLRELLESGVEIGQTVNVDGGYVKFIAWNGSVADRTKRAQNRIRWEKKTNREFSFWLCLSSNVDEWERKRGEETGVPPEKSIREARQEELGGDKTD